MKILLPLLTLSLATAHAEVPIPAQSGQAETKFDQLPLKGSPKKPVWNGWWWSDSTNGLGYKWAGDDTLSPIEKYEAITGNKYRALDWEFRHHRTADQNSSAGQCDGYAIASAVEPEPRQAVMCRGIRFEAPDVKALLGSVYLGDMSGQKVTVVGAGTFGASGNPPLTPYSFHLTLTNVMGREKRGMYVDAGHDGSIYNMPLASYEMTVDRRESPGGGTIVNVVASVNLAKYDTPPGELMPHGLRTLPVSMAYELELDAQGNVLPGKGRWLREKRPILNLKVPMSGGPVKTQYNNPFVDLAIVRELAARSSGTGSGSYCSQPMATNPNFQRSDTHVETRTDTRTNRAPRPPATVPSGN